MTGWCNREVCYACGSTECELQAEIDRLRNEAKSAAEELKIAKAFHRTAVAERDCAFAQVEKLRNELAAEMATCARLRAALRPVIACPCTENTTADEAAHNCMTAVIDALHIWRQGGAV